MRCICALTARADGLRVTAAGHVATGAESAHDGARGLTARLDDDLIDADASDAFGGALRELCIAPVMNAGASHAQADAAFETARRDVARRPFARNGHDARAASASDVVAYGTPGTLPMGPEDWHAAPAGHAVASTSAMEHAGPMEEAVYDDVDAKVALVMASVEVVRLIGMTDAWIVNRPRNV